MKKIKKILDYSDSELENFISDVVDVSVIAGWFLFVVIVLCGLIF